MNPNPLDGFLKKCLVKEGRTLIVGSKIHDGTCKDDRRKRYEDAVGVDMCAGEGVDIICNLEDDFAVNKKFLEGLPEAFDHIECTSVLEHSRRPWLMALNLERILSDDGTILIMVPWVWRIHNYPSDYYRYTPAAIESLFSGIEWIRKKYIVEGKLVDEVPRVFIDGTRYFARSELIMFGRKCASIS